MATFLETVVDRTRKDLEARKNSLSEAALDATVDGPRRERPFSEALIAEGISLIAEMKRASPSRGPIRPGADVAEIVSTYEASGARAASILTEPHWFGGALEDLAAARAACRLPLLRKDFIVERYQLLEARKAGADAVLLIVAALDHDDLQRLLTEAGDLGMDALVEVHDEEDLEVAIGCGAEVIGINNRDLKKLEVDVETTYRLLADIPAGTVVVAESGIVHRDQVRDLQDAGVDAILVGEAIMGAEDPALAIETLMG